MGGELAFLFMITGRQEEVLSTVVKHGCDMVAAGEELYPLAQSGGNSARMVLKHINKEDVINECERQGFCFEESIGLLINGMRTGNFFVKERYLTMYWKLIGAFAAQKIDVRSASFKKVEVSGSQGMVEAARKAVLEAESA